MLRLSGRVTNIVKSTRMTPHGRDREEPMRALLERLSMLFAGGVIVALLSTFAWGRSPIDRFYVFGDSYSDGGNGYSMVQRPPRPPYEARYSNGLTAVEYLAKTFGTPLRNSNEGRLPANSNINFAVSGA